MPTYRGITLTLHTPFSIEGVPEIAPPLETAVAEAGSPIKKLIDESKFCVSVYVPVMPQSLFWLSYNVEEPPTEPKGIFYVFKLLINRKEIVTWCCGEEEQWKGKTMFGLFDTGKDQMVGGAGMEKRVFKFSEQDWRVVGDLGADKETDRLVEVRVCRGNVKIRVPRKSEVYSGSTAGTGVELANGGLTKRGHPRTFYKFGLIDAVDSPFAIFRFYYRTWGELSGPPALSPVPEADSENSEEIDGLNLRMGQVDLNESDSVFSTLQSDKSGGPEEKKSDNAEQIAGSDHSSASALERCSYNSISGQYFSYRNDVIVKNNSSPAGDASQKKAISNDGDPINFSIPRGRASYAPRVTRDTSYQLSEGEQVSLMLNIPSIPPPVPVHGMGSATPWYFAPAMPTAPPPSPPGPELSANVKRLSIPPSTTLRPVLDHGPLPASPTKAGSSNEERQQKKPLGPREQSAKVRSERGGILKSMKVNGLKRRTANHDDRT